MRVCSLNIAIFYAIYNDFINTIAIVINTIVVFISTTEIVIVSKQRMLFFVCNIDVLLYDKDDV